jgi:hypothetical protein
MSAGYWCFDSIDVSLEASAFASAGRLSSRFREIKRSEPTRASFSCAEANCCAETDRMLHGSRRANANPPTKHGPNFFGLFATRRPSIVGDNGPIQPDLSRISKPA